jgi:hypothetical protein
MAHSLESLRRNSLSLLVAARELREAAAAARERSARCKAMSAKAAEVGRNARAMADILRERQRSR